MTHGARIALQRMTPHWQFAGKRTFDANGAVAVLATKPGAIETELQRDARGRLRAAYRLTPAGVELQQEARS